MPNDSPSGIWCGARGATKWHPAETWASGSATDYAEKMLFIRCGTAHFFVGTIDGRARDTKAVKSPLELELWRVRNDGRTISGELRRDANGWDVLIRDNGEPVFSRRCTSEDEGRYIANGLKHDELKTGSIEVTAHRDMAYPFFQTPRWRARPVARRFRA